MDTRSEKNFKGIDISHWQGNVDFRKVKMDGIKIVYIKATEGTNFIDNNLNKFYEGAKGQGLNIGFYHYFKPSLDPKEQARHFSKVIENKLYNCRLALDIEVTEGYSKEEITTKAIAFLEEIKRLTGTDVVIYTYTSFANRSLTSKLATYPLWIAHYNVNAPGLNKIWNHWIGFQYTDLGMISGINGRCNLDEFTNEILLK